MKKISFLRWVWLTRFGGRTVNLDELSRDQERVMQGYKDSGAVQTPADEEALHMFFSPSRVVSGMTNEEVRICISLYPLKGKQIASQRLLNGDLSPLMRPIHLPLEFRTDISMSRRCFRIGIVKFLQDVAQREIAAREMVTDSKATIVPTFLSGME
jgi:hypothetical protein